MLINHRRFGNGSLKAVLLGNTVYTPPVVTPPVTTPPGSTIPAMAPSRASTKFFATPASSVVAPNQPVTVTIEFNGLVPTSGTITPASSSTGTFAPSTITLDGSAKTFTYTPSIAGEHNISFANTASLYNSAPAPINVFAASSGSAQTMAATLRLGDQSVHQRDVPTGTPNGFATANTAGWGEVWVNVDRAVPAIYARLYDRRSTGWATSPGTGTQLTNGWVQVYGSTSGAKQVRLLLPAIRAKQISLDLATDAAGTTPVRVANCFAVGTVILLTTRSQLTGYGRGYATGNNDNNGNHINKIVNWDKTAISLASDVRYADTSGTWARVAGEVFDPTSYADHFYGEPTSNGTLETGRLIDQQTGMMLGITGIAYIGGGWQAFLNDSGQPTSSTLDTFGSSSGGKARYWILAGGNWDDRADSAAAYSIVYDKAPDWVMRNIPTIANVGICMGATGLFGSDGSRDYGYTRNACRVIERENALPHMVSFEDSHWNSFVNGHASQGARPLYVREHIRLLLSAEISSWGGLQTTNRGPTLASTGTRSGAVLRIPIKFNGASSVTGIKFTFPDWGTFVKSAASASDLVGLVAVYPQGGRAGDGATTPIPVSGVVINTGSPPTGYGGTLDITLSGSGPYLSAYTVHYMADFNTSGGTGVAPAIVDNIDPFGVGYGQHMRPALDIAVI